MASRFTPARCVGRSSFAVLLAMSAWLAAGCSERGSAEKLAEDAPLLVSTTSTAVAVLNRAGLPLTDVKMVIVPYGPVVFEKSIARLEATERREVALGEFRSGDGAALNLRFVKPKSVRVSARDVVGKSYEVELPWR